jgi:hypothetical protein
MTDSGFDPRRLSWGGQADRGPSDLGGVDPHLVAAV